VPPPEPSTSGTEAQASAGDPDQQPAPALQALEERVIDAAQAAIPLGLLAALKLAETIRSKAPSAGRSGAVQKSQLRGRPIGARRGEPRAGQRLNLIESLRAAAPWQALRQAGRAQQLSASDGAAPAAPRIQVRKEDFHVSRFRQRGQTTTVFVVDASGSAALHRLAEAKGAVELLLADCYVRRDSVAVLAFRGKTTELLLPVTRSLARAKRSLAGLPGGGGTPLASGIDAARALGEQIRRKGETPVIVLLTDGRGNIARDGTPGRTQAALDASAAARQLRAAGLTALLLDTSAQPQPVAQALAADMGARYVALPYAGAQGLSQAVRVVVGGAARAQ
jgi:magnesium chelatase subunit D